MTTVLLGVCEERISSKTVTSWKDNKLGGMPDWYQSTVPNPKCVLCGRKSLFICQLYCPLVNSQYNRTLYVFACCNKSCRNRDGSWSVLRIQSLTKQEPSKSLSNVSDPDFWGVDDISWSDEDDDVTTCCSDNSKICESVSSSADESSNLMITHLPEVEEMPGQCFSDGMLCSEPGESKIAEQNGQKCDDDETVVKLTQLSMTDDSESEKPVDGIETPVLTDEEHFVASDSILSQILVNSNHSNEDVPTVAEIDSVDFVFDSFYINAYNEEDFSDDLKHCRALERKYLQHDSDLRSFLHELDETASSSQRKSTKGASANFSEKYGVNEYDKKPVHFDRSIMKFTEKIRLCPQQVIRYSYNGTALHFKEETAKRDSPLCVCGSPRIFEMQLMPGMVDYLRLPMLSESLFEFGSVYIFTCANSCWTENTMEPREEFIFSAEYSDQKLFRKDF